MSSHMLDVDKTLWKLTLAEKASLTSGSAFWHTAPIQRLGLPRLMLSDGPHGLRPQPGQGDHLGIGGSLAATCFPTASTIAPSWNPDLLRRIGQALADEARSMKLSVVLGPGINMKRSPLCGRNFEYFSEDPFLTGELAVGVVQGIQSCGIGTSVKHYAANNQETDRHRIDAQVDERTLREIYLPAFERVVRIAQPWTVMCAYNKVNGIPASENSWLLTTVLREEFGFEGVVVSDWGAVTHRVPALLAGVDLEMPPALGRSPEAIIAAVQSAEVPLKVLDASARRMLDLIGKCIPALEHTEPFDEEAHHHLARQAAAESIVLLTNPTGVLPLKPDAKVAVLGEFARTPRYQGSGSSQVKPTRLDTVLSEFEAVHDAVSFAPAYRIEALDDDEVLLDEAVEVAENADIVVMLLGLPGQAESEGIDRTHMNLPPNQLRALSRIAAVHPMVVVVLVNGSAVLLGDVIPRAAALVEAGLGGQAAGAAIVDVLTGAVNPSGRLAETIPHRLEDNPAHVNFPGDSQMVRYGEGVFIGYRGYDKNHQDIAFPFGHGLSYTTFELTDMRIELHGSVTTDTLEAVVTVTVHNIGDRDGTEVVQLYVEDLEACVVRPIRELKGFAKTHVRAGGVESVTIRLDQRAFSYWSTKLRQWVVEVGEFTIAAGHSSRNLTLRKTILIDAPSLTAVLTEESTLSEWMNDPLGRRLIENEIEGGQSAVAIQPDVIHIFGGIPLATLANFDGTSLDYEAVERVVRAWNEPDCGGSSSSARD